MNTAKLPRRVNPIFTRSLALSELVFVNRQRYVCSADTAVECEEE